MSVHFRWMFVVLNLLIVRTLPDLAQNEPLDLPGGVEVAAVPEVAMTPAAEALVLAAFEPPIGEASACHGWYTCPSPKSCGSWSTYQDCDQPFCGWDDYCEYKSGGDATVQPRERFRYCVLGDGSPCYEYQVISWRLHCGCV